MKKILTLFFTLLITVIGFTQQTFYSVEKLWLYDDVRDSTSVLSIDEHVILLSPGDSIITFKNVTRSHSLNLKIRKLTDISKSLTSKMTMYSYDAYDIKNQDEYILAVFRDPLNIVYAFGVSDLKFLKLFIVGHESNL